LFNCSLENLPHISQGFIDPRQWQIPASVVGDARRIVKLVALFENGRSPTKVPQHPELLKPRDMTNLPAERIHDLQARTDPLLFCEVCDEFHCPRTCLP